MKRSTRFASMLALAMSACACVAVHDGSAQETTDGAVRSSWSGVYTAEQAERGRETYAGACQGCHTVASHSGVAFRNGWGGRLLSELLSYLRDQMPKSEPGSLTPGEYLDITAYLLKLNGMPAGTVALPDDLAALRRIRIDTSAKGP